MAKSAVTEKLSKLKIEVRQKIPAWKGPCVDGCTQSLISNYLSCKERFRLYTIEGLTTQDQFNHSLEYGNLFHLAEETYSKKGDWKAEILKYAKKLCRHYPLAKRDIDKWYNVCLIQFPIYVEYWNQRGQSKYIQLLQEQIFDVPYLLPSGREVRLRGKIDGFEMEKGKKVNLVWHREHKTKADIWEEKISRQLLFDLQVGVYFIAAHQEPLLKAVDEAVGRRGDWKFAGVHYNVVRRPLGGGKGSIKKRKGTKNRPGETDQEFYRRLQGVIGDNADTFFMRWDIPITRGDIKIFADTCLNPILENLCDDYEWWNYCYRNGKNVWDGELRLKVFDHSPRHFRLPFGARNVLLEGGQTEFDEYLLSGSKAGLVQVDSLFGELE